jgi:rubrerythrin
MTLQDAQIHELELMARHEEAIGELYAAYARRFPEHQEFWLKLKNEEIGHAGIIRKLFPKIDDGFIRFDDKRFNVKAIETSLKYINTWTSDADNGTVEMLNALAIALDLENGMIEKKFLDVFEADADDLKIAIKALSDGTREHKQRIAELLNEYKRKNMDPQVPIG